MSFSVAKNPSYLTVFGQRPVGSLRQAHRAPGPLHLMTRLPRDTWPRAARLWKTRSLATDELQDSRGPATAPAREGVHGSPEAERCRCRRVRWSPALHR